MNYALIEDGIVTNIIWLYPANADEFPNAVPLGDVPAGIGDSYDGEVFYRDGERILSYAEREIEETEDMRSALALLGVAAGDAEVESAETQPEAADSGEEVESAETQLEATDSGAEVESAEAQPDATDSGEEAENAEAQPDASDKKEASV